MVENGKKMKRGGFELWHVVALCVSFGIVGCGNSLEGSIEKLGLGGNAAEEGRQELLLAKDRAVEPLLAALEDPKLLASRVGLVDVLASLLKRVDDERIEVALLRHLHDDEQAMVRANIVHRLGLHRPKRYIRPFMAALVDTSGAVCHELLLVLGKIEDQLSPEQRTQLQQVSRRLVTHSHKGVRLEAAIRVENFVNHWLEKGRELALQAQLAEAESLFTLALLYSPSSQRGNYQLARFYMDNGRQIEGETLLRSNGMLLDVKRLHYAPTIDGQLDESVWEEAVQADSFYQHSSVHYAAIPSPQRTRIYLGYTDRALYFGFYGYDAHPDSLKGSSRNFDSELWYEDTVELFIDPEFSHREYIHVGINHLGTVHDAWLRLGMRHRSVDWNADARAAVYVGDDFWSVEYRLGFAEPELPVPRSGSRWGFNFVRVFRGAEYSQWVRTYDGGHRPNEFGLLVFE